MLCPYVRHTLARELSYDIALMCSIKDCLALKKLYWACLWWARHSHRNCNFGWVCASICPSNLVQTVTSQLMVVFPCNYVEMFNKMSRLVTLRPSTLCQRLRSHFSAFCRDMVVTICNFGWVSVPLSDLVWAVTSQIIVVILSNLVTSQFIVASSW